MRSFKHNQRIAILNRGEPALRFLRSLKELNIERRWSLRSIAMYTDGDELEPYVRAADETIELGPAMQDGVNAYVNKEQILQHLLDHNVNAVWPGWGFLSEDADFVAMLERQNIIFVGPSSAAMRQLGDKIASKELAAECGVPMAPWSKLSADIDSDTLHQQASKIGFPLMLKASAGGGGRGIRKVDSSDDLDAALFAVRAEVERSFGQGGVLMEQCVTQARHIEVQLVGTPGKAYALGTRDCSIQRKHQKVIEECPSPNLSPALIEKLSSSACILMERANYVGVGTAEFLLQPETGMCSFLEINSRLQVEHTITEECFQIDLIQAQILIAMAEPWEAPRHHGFGHAIELRVNAERPEQDFQPSPGRIALFRPPAGRGIRVDSGVVEGSLISPHFDSMIAKIIAWAPTRKQAIARALRACRELDAVVEDGATNQAFLCDILQHPAFTEAKADTRWLDRAMKDGEVVTVGYAEEALTAAAVLEYRKLRHKDRLRFFVDVQDGMPLHYPKSDGAEFALRLRGQHTTIRVTAISEETFLIAESDRCYWVKFKVSSNNLAEMWLHTNDGQDIWHKIVYSYGSSGITIELDGYSHTIERSSGGIVASPSPAVVVRISVREGQSVSVGDRLCTLEAMKMEMGVFAQEAGVVKTILCQPNQQVPVGQPLIILTPTSEGIQQNFPFKLNTPICLQRWTDERAQPNPAQLEQHSEEEQEQMLAELNDLIQAIMLGYELPEPIFNQLELLLSSDRSFQHLQLPEKWYGLLLPLQQFASTAIVLDRNVFFNIHAEVSTPADVAFFELCRRHHEGEDAVPPALQQSLKMALSWYDSPDWGSNEEIRSALFRIAKANANNEARHQLASLIIRSLIHLHAAGLTPPPQLDEVLENVSRTARSAYPFLQDNALQAHYLFFDQPKYSAHQEVLARYLADTLEQIKELPSSASAVRASMRHISQDAQPLQVQLLKLLANTDQPHRILELLVSRCHHGAELEWVKDSTMEQHPVVLIRSRKQMTVAASCSASKLLSLIKTKLPKETQQIELFLTDSPSEKELQHILKTPISNLGLDRLVLSWLSPLGEEHHRCFEVSNQQFQESVLFRDIHPEAARRVHLNVLSNFQLERVYTHEHIYAFLGQAKHNVRDERIFVIAEIFGATSDTRSSIWAFERVFFEALRALRAMQSKRTKRSRLRWNWMLFYVHPRIDLGPDQLQRIAERLEPHTRELNLREVRLVIKARENRFKAATLILRRSGSGRLSLAWESGHQRLIPEMSPYDMRVVRAQKVGCIYPYELLHILEGHGSDEWHSDLRQGKFQEHDLNAENELVPVLRPMGGNSCGVVVGILSHCTEKYPEGLNRVWIASDPTKAMGALAEAECRRIIEALKLAKQKQLPVEWVPVSAGAMISMDSGTENLDWTARVLAEIIGFTQAGGQINLIVQGINVGAQSYWNAEATMLMHTRGTLIMTLDGSMVLTGKKALDFSGSVSAEDERGIGGAERIMGPNGQAQFIVNSMSEAYRTLFEWYRHTYCAANETQPRLAITTDPNERDISQTPYHSELTPEFSKISDLFSTATNPDRKKPFAVRSVMAAVVDQDSPPLERFQHLKDGETAAIWLAQIGGHPVTLIGIESQPILRRGRIPTDGPEQWMGGTLFPQSSRKVARAINSASGVHPVVVLANLSGFDGSPESLRRLQLEYGAEIGRAVVNFDGPIVFVVIGRYHGGAYVVFSKALNANLRALAIKGSFASVIGGAPAAAVVFPRQVRKAMHDDPRLQIANDELAQADSLSRTALREQLEQLKTALTLEKRGELAAQFDATHSVERAVDVGSLDAVIEAHELRPVLIAELEQSRTNAY